MGSNSWSLPSPKKACTSWLPFDRHKITWSNALFSPCYSRSEESYVPCVQLLSKPIFEGCARWEAHQQRSSPLELQHTSRITQGKRNSAHPWRGEKVEDLRDELACRSLAEPSKMSTETTTEGLLNDIIVTSNIRLPRDHLGHRSLP